MLRPTFRSCSILVFLALVPACDREASTPAQTKTDAPASAVKPAAGATNDARACDAARGKALEQELLAQCAVTERLVGVDVPSVPWKLSVSASASASAYETLQLQLSPEGVAVGWEPPMPVDELPAKLVVEGERAQAMASAMAAPVALEWRLAIAGATPRADVAKVLQGLVAAERARGYVQLGTQADAAVPVPRDPKQLAELKTLLVSPDPSQKAMLLAKEIEKVMPPCPALVATFSAVATVAAEQRCKILARGISEGLVTCGCPDEDPLMTLLYAVSVGTEVPTRLGIAVPVTLDPQASSRPGATWAEVVAGLDEAAFSGLWVGSETP